MISPKTVSVINSESFLKHAENVEKLYIKSLDAVDQFKISIGEKYKSYYESIIEVSMTKFNRGITEFDYITEYIKNLKNPIYMGVKIRHVESFISFFLNEKLLVFHKNVPKRKYIDAFLNTVYIYLMKFPGPKEITRLAYDELNRRYFDSISSIKFGCLAVGIDAILISGTIVRATVGSDPMEPCYIFIHQGSMFKSDWLVYKTWTLNFSWTIAIEPSLNPNVSKSDNISKILGIKKSKILPYLEMKNSKLSTMFLEYYHT